MPLNILALIDDIPVGKYHYRLLGLLTGAYLIDGAMILVMSSTVDSVLASLHVDIHVHRGIILSVLYIGCIIGNLGGGFLSDIYGRRHMAIGGLAGVIVACILESQVQTLSQLLLVRLFFGVALGSNITSQNVIILEMTPSDSRSTLSGLLLCMFGVGQIFGSILLLIYMPYLTAPNDEWRSIALLISTPSVICLLGCLFYLDESPAYLVSTGQESKALAIVAHMAEVNGVETEARSASTGDCAQNLAPCDEDELAEPSVLEILFSEEFLATTIGSVYLSFVCNFCVVGAMYLLPDLTHSFLHHLVPGQAIVANQMLELPAGVLAILLARSDYSFRTLLSFLFPLWTVSNLLIASTSFYVSFPAVCLTKCMASMTFILFYIYLGETFPTNARATGSGLAMSAGRFGAIVTPLMYDALVDDVGMTNGKVSFIVTMSGLLLFSTFLTPFMPVGQKHERLLQRPSCIQSGTGGTEYSVRSIQTGSTYSKVSRVSATL